MSWKTQTLGLHKLQFGFICQRTTSPFKTWLCAFVAFQISSKCTPPALLIPLSPLPASQLRKSKMLGKAKSVLEPDQRFVCSSVWIGRRRRRVRRESLGFPKSVLLLLLLLHLPSQRGSAAAFGGPTKSRKFTNLIHTFSASKLLLNLTIFRFKPLDFYLISFEKQKLNIRYFVYFHIWWNQCCSKLELERERTTEDSTAAIWQREGGWSLQTLHRADQSVSHMHRFSLNFFVRVSRDHFKFKTISKRETLVWSGFSVCEQVYFSLSLSFPVLPIIAAAAAAKEGLRNLGDLLLLRFPNSLAEEERSLL